MNPLNEYALLEIKIKELKDKQEELKPEIMKMLEGMEDMKAKEPYGTFSIVRSTKYEYSKALLRRVDEIEIEKQFERENKIAKPIIKESLRFMPSKFGLPNGVYKFDKKV